MKFSEIVFDVDNFCVDPLKEIFYKRGFEAKALCEEENFAMFFGF